MDKLRKDKLAVRYTTLLQGMIGEDLDTKPFALTVGNELFRKVYPDLDYVENSLAKEETVFENYMRNKAGNRDLPSR